MSQSSVDTSPEKNLRSDWHAITASAALAQLQSDKHGLSHAEAATRLSKYGPNLLPQRGPTPLWKIVILQFASPLIYVLVIAAVVSLAIGESKDAIFITAVLVINAVIGAYQESQAERSSHALKKLLRTKAMVERGGETREIAADQLVPGDMVLLESGNRVPADLRLLTTHGFEVDESLLTGESNAVVKDANSVGSIKQTLADQHNMAFAGSMVSRGRGKGVVVATGINTHVGQMAIDILSASGGKPPLLARMERFTNQIAIGTVSISLLIGALGMILWNHTLVDMFFLVIALAVSAIPEGLPVAMTVALAVATHRMARRNVIVRRLTAVEGLGSCTLIATDKTGTLTCNELTVREVCLVDGRMYEVTGEGFTPRGHISYQNEPILLENEPVLQEFLKAAVLCNEAELRSRDGEWIWRGDAVDVAILSLGIKAGMQRSEFIANHPQTHEIPFESADQFAATYHRDGNQTLVCVKGSPEKLIAMSREHSSGDGFAHAEHLALNMAKRGLRVIAVAAGTLPDQLSPDQDPPRPGQLKLLGFLGMIDPLRPDVAQSIAECQAAGVKVMMITGDHKITALAIARDLGLVQSDDQVMTADQIEGKSPGELAEIINRIRVFARVTPKQKLQIVNAAREAGHFVAVTGDGVNDAPALRAANIGVAMGKSGTDIAREAAELVLSDDDFKSIVAGIEEGRIAYDNIRKVTYLLLSLGAAELLMVLLSVILGHPIPLLPVQLLWLNLVTDGIQSVALAFEPGEGDSLRHQPRPPNESIFNRLMLERLFVTVLVVGGGGFLVYHLSLQAGWKTEDARNLLLLVMVLFENFHIGNCRSETKSAFALSPLRSPILFYGTIIAFLVHVLAMYLPFLQDILGTRPLSVSSWLLAICVAILIVPAIEWHKWFWNQRLRVVK